MSLFDELRRRNVFRVAIAYLFVGWLLTEVATTLLPTFGAPEWVAKVLIFIIALGFIPSVIFSWVYELTPEGLKKEGEVDRTQSITDNTGQKLDRIIIAVLVVALAYFAVDKFILAPKPESPVTSATEVAVETARKTIAVLPFINMSSDKEQEYFSDGLSEELLNLLAKIPELKVTSRSSAFSFKGKDFKIVDVGRELNVNHVLEGSVRRSGDKVRITAQLIRVSDDAHMWSETWDRTLDDVFVIQDEIAQAVVDVLRIKLLGATPKAPMTNGDTFSLYLQARYLVIERSEAGMHRAEVFLKQALEIDPDYAPAWEGLATVYARGARMGAWPSKDAVELAQQAAERALELDPENGRAYAVLAEVSYSQDNARSMQLTQQALSLEPGDSLVIMHAAEQAMRFGQYEYCLDLAADALVLDPVNFTIYTVLGYCNLMSDRIDAAILNLEKKIAVNPESFGAHYYLTSALVISGKFDRALEVIAKEVNRGFQLTGLALIHHALGNASASDAALAELIAEWSERDPYQITAVYAYRGQTELALQWLERAYASGDRGLMIVLGDPFLDSLRDEPRFKAVLEKLDLTAID